jgi:hypothetical protein
MYYWSPNGLQNSDKIFDARAKNHSSNSNFGAGLLFGPSQEKE